MAEKTMSAAELLELAKSGGMIKFDQKPIVIEQMGELLEKLSEMILADEKRTQADLARSQVQLEVLDRLQTLVRKNGTKSLVSRETIDLSPLRGILAQIIEANAARAIDYDFTILKDGGGGIAKVQARAVHPTIN